MIFRLSFDDNTQYSGGSFKGEWNKSPDKIIKKLEFEFGNSYVCLKGYEEYNHLYERIAFQTSYVSKLFLMGREENRTIVIMYDFMKKEIFKRYVSVGHEYCVEVTDDEGIVIELIPQLLQGWKQGKLNNPKYDIKRK